MTNRVILGELPDDQFGLKVSKPGFNVLDDTLRNEQLAFDSRWDGAFTLFMSGTHVATSDTTSYVTLSFPQVLTEIPFVIVDRWRTGESVARRYIPVSTSSYASGSNAPTGGENVRVTTSNIRIPNMIAALGYRYNYYVFTRKQ